MTEYIVFVETSDYFIVEAEDAEQAKEKAKEIAASCSRPGEWQATWAAETADLKR